MVVFHCVAVAENESPSAARRGTELQIIRPIHYRVVAEKFHSPSTKFVCRRAQRASFARKFSVHWCKRRRTRIAIKHLPKISCGTSLLFTLAVPASGRIPYTNEGRAQSPTHTICVRFGIGGDVPRRSAAAIRSAAHVVVPPNDNHDFHCERTPRNTNENREQAA